MSQELTVALRIKAFLTEARQAVRDLKGDLKGLRDEADQVASTLAKVDGAGAGSIAPAAVTPGATPSTPLPPAPTPAPANPGPKGDSGLKQQEKDLKALVAQLDPATAASERMAKAQTTLSAALARGAIDEATYTKYLQILKSQQQGAAGTAELTTAQIQGLTHSVRSFGEMVAMGANPLQAFAMEAGKLSGTFGGGGNALKAVMSLLTPLRIALGGVTAGVIALALAYRHGADQQDAFNRAVELSGGKAGATASDLQDMAVGVAKVVGSQSKAAEVLTQMAASGDVGRDSLEKFTVAALKMERVGGQAASETAKNFSELQRDPLKATLKFNDSLHYMTGALYDQIQALLRKGEADKAGEVAQAAYARAIEAAATSLEPKLSLLERAWLKVSDAAKKAWDSMGHPPSVSDQIAEQAKLVEALEQKAAERAKKGLPLGILGDKLGAARNRLQDLNQDKEEQDSLARTRAEAAKVKDEMGKARQENEQWHDAALPKQELLNQKLDVYRKNVEKIRKAGGKVSPEEQQREERAIRESVMGSDLQNVQAQGAVQQALLQANLRNLQQSVADGDAIIEQALKDGNVTIEAAYTARLSAMNTEGEAQRRVYLAEIAELDKAIRTAKTPLERAPLVAQRIQIEAQVKVLDASLVEQARKLGIWRRDQERELSAITAKIRVDVSNLTGTFDREAVRRQILESMRPTIEEIGRMEPGPEKDLASRQAKLLADAGEAQAAFNSKLAEAQRIQDQLSVTENALQVQQQQGTISQIELEARLRAARAAQVPALEAIIAQLLVLRDAMPPDAKAAIDAMSKSIGDLKNQTSAATPVVVDFGTRLKNTAIDGLADAAASAVTNFKDLRSTVSDILKQIAADIVRSGVKKALIDQFSSSGGGGGGGGFLAAAISIGKSIFGFADGGLIRGPGTGTSDSIPALVGGRRPIAVSDHEFIQPARAVKHYGVGFMEAVRTMRLPRPGYAFGGLVAAHQRARFATGGPVTAGPAAAPSVVVQVVNNGTPQRVVDQRQQFDGKQMVVSVVVDDLSRGGPISQAMRSRR